MTKKSIINFINNAAGAAAAFVTCKTLQERSDLSNDQIFAISVAAGVGTANTILPMAELGVSTLVGMTKEVISKKKDDEEEEDIDDDFDDFFDELEEELDDPVVEAPAAEEEAPTKKKEEEKKEKPAEEQTEK